MDRQKPFHTLRNERHVLSNLQVKERKKSWKLPNIQNWMTAKARCLHEVDSDLNTQASQQLWRSEDKKEYLQSIRKTTVSQGFSSWTIISRRGQISPLSLRLRASRFQTVLLQPASPPLGGCVQTDFAATPPSHWFSVGLAWDPQIRISDRFPADSDAADLQTTLRTWNHTSFRR